MWHARDGMMNVVESPLVGSESLQHSSPKEVKKKVRKKALNVSYDLLPDQGALHKRAWGLSPTTRNPGNKSLLPISTLSAPMNIAMKIR